MQLNILWFVLVGVLFTVFFVLEGFDFGVGMLLPFLGRNDDERRVMINAIGPHWDGNEVWLLTAGGAIFAAFPHWYATLFSGFYLALFLVLLALIARGAAFEFRSKHPSPKWRSVWDWAIFVGSLLPPVLLGVAVANMIGGTKIDQTMTFVGSFWDLLNPYGLLGGVTLGLLFVLHGAAFLALKTTGDISQRSRRIAFGFWIPAAVALLVCAGATYLVGRPAQVGLFVVAAIIATIAILLAGWFLRQQKAGAAFVATALTIAFASIVLFATLYPNVMVSSLNPAWSLTVQNASSSPYTLQVMTIVAAIFVPIVLIYQGWSYWAFRKKLDAKPEGLIY
jgi:cytochrome bd ubiquinol oxidase subunit II